MVKVRQSRVPIILGLAVLLIAGCVAGLLLSQEAVAETRLIGAPFSNPTASTTQAGQATKITPEQGAALVEVQKILKEARQIAESIELPNPLVTKPHLRSGLERVKTQLMEDLEKAQLRAGDFSMAGSTKQADLLALAQAAYGKTKDAVQTTSRPRVINDDALLVLVDMLIKVGDVPAALKAVDGTLAKGVAHAGYAQRLRDRAAALSLIARRQYEHGDPAAKATLQQAVDAAQDVVDPEDSYWAFLHTARVQGVLGDRAGSLESFRQALRAAKGRGDEENPPAGKLLWLAKAQAESGDISTSVKTFEETIQLSHTLKEPRARAIHLECTAWAQGISGFKGTATQTFKKALEEAEAVRPEDRWGALLEVGNWQLKAGDNQGVAETVQYLLQRADSFSVGPLKSAGFGAARALAVSAGNFKLAMILLEKISDDWEKSGALRFITESLIRTKDPYGTQEVFTRLSESATAILKNPPPKERSKANMMLSSIAIVQAAGGNTSNALETADGISTLSTRIETYGRVAILLTAKGDFPSAQQVIGAMKEGWLSFSESKGAVRKLATERAKAGDETGALSWGRKQNSEYAKANALLGVATGLMDHHGIEDIERLVPTIPMREVCFLRPSERL